MASELEGGLDKQSASPKEHNDSVWASLAREGSMLAQGIGSGMCQQLEDHPVQSAVTGVAAAGMGVGLAYMQRKVPGLAMAAECVGLAATVSAAKSFLGGTEWDSVSKAVKRTWESDAHFAEDSQIIGRTLGPLALDTTVMALGSGLGAYSGRKFFGVGSPAAEPSIRVKEPTIRVVDSAPTAKSLSLGVTSEGSLDSATLSRWMVKTVDPETAAHSLRVTRYSDLLAERLGISPQESNLTHLSAIVHDIGKSRVSPAILQNPKELTAWEMAQMRLHARYSEEILGRLSLPENLQSMPRIAGSHHELYDGSGYLRGLKGNEIPLEARIITVADILDAISQRRVYKPGMPIADTLDLMKLKFMGTRVPKFDPEVWSALEAIPRSQLRDIKRLQNIESLLQDVALVG